MKSISVRGYKAINKEKEISLAPINLIIGPNGSGKSTLINSLLLSKGLLKAEINDQRSFISAQVENPNYEPKDLYSNGKYDLAFMPRLINPFDSVGKFKKADINNNSNQKDFSISLPVELSYFSDSFKIELTYFIEKNNNALVTGLKLINETKKSILFSAEITSEVSNNLCSCLVKIDVDYLIDFISKVKSENKNYKPTTLEDFNLKPGIDISWEEMAEMEDQAREDNAKFRKKFFKAFKEESNCSLPNPQESKSSNPSYLLNYYNKISDLDFFNYSKGDNKTFNIREDRKIHDIAIDFEKEWLDLIKNGYEFQIESSGFASICLSRSMQGELPFYINEGIFPNIILPSKLSLFNIKISCSNKTDFIFNQLLLRNMNHSLKRLYKEVQDLVYIPPNRIRNYKVNKDLSNEDIITLLITRLNNMQYEDKWAKPSEYFVNYWLNEFNLKNKVNFNTIDDIISLFNFNSSIENDSKVDLGYGISQLIPLICLFSLFNEKYKVSSLDPAINDQYIQTWDTNNCFLIEEPEANLHPSFQSKLADLFIDASWKFGHQFVIETHSEYMVRKFQYWVAKGKIKPSDVNIYYFDNKNDDPLINDLVIKKISINKDGSLSEPFGEGFYDEATNLQFDLLKIKNTQNN
jgi:AAA15 family ATPase/GTPase